jgi:TolA-binding protein
MTERLTKKQLKQDRFLDTTRHIAALARENVALTILGIAAFVALIAVGVRVGGSAAGGGGGGMKSSASEKALIDARTQFLTGDLEAGRAALDDVRTRHAGSRAGREATYLLGNTLYELGQYDEARRTFEDFLKKPLYDDLLKDGALLAIAACREEAGDLSGALADYTSLWNTASNPGTRLQAAMAGARCAKLQGLDARARELYQGVVDTFPDAPESQEARFAVLGLEGPSS